MSDLGDVLAGHLISERLRDFRDLEGLTQTQLGNILGISQNGVSDVELNKVPPDNLVELIVDEFHYPWSFFRDDTYAQLRDLAAGTLRFRKQAKASAKATERVTAIFRELYRLASFLGTATGVRPPDLTQLHGLSPSEAGAAARDLLGVPPDQPVDHVVRRCEAVGIVVFPVRLPGFSPDDEIVGHAGTSAWEGPWDLPCISYMPAMPGDRQRHTVAHELGHLVLHSSVLGGVSKERARALEREASTFASAFLLPPGPMRAAIGSEAKLAQLKALKAGWGVSISSLIVRSRDLNLIDEERTTSLFKQLSARGWRKNEPVLVSNETPVLLPKMANRVFGNMDIEDAAQQAATPPHLLREILAGWT